MKINREKDKFRDVKKIRQKNKRSTPNLKSTIPLRHHAFGSEPL